MQQGTKRKSLAGLVVRAGLFVCLVLGVATYLALSFLETRLPLKTATTEDAPLPLDPALAKYTPLDGNRFASGLPVVRAALALCTEGSELFIYAPPSGEAPVLVYSHYSRAKSFSLPDQEESVFSLACLTHAVVIWAEGQSGITAYALHMELGAPVLQSLGRVVDYPKVFTSAEESLVTITPYGTREARSFRFAVPFSWTTGDGFTAPDWPHFVPLAQRGGAEEEEHGGDSGIPLLARMVCKNFLQTGRRNNGLEEARKPESGGFVIASVTNDAKGAPYLYIEEDGSETELFFMPESAVCYNGDALFYGTYYDNSPILAGILDETPPLKIQRKDALQSVNASGIPVFSHSIWLLDPLSIACPPYGLPFPLPEGHELFCDFVTSFGRVLSPFFPSFPSIDSHATRYGIVFPNSK